MTTIAECKKELKALGVTTKLQGQTLPNPFGGDDRVRITVHDYDPAIQGPTPEEMKDALPAGGLLDIIPVLGIVMTIKTEPGEPAMFCFTDTRQEA